MELLIKYRVFVIFLVLFAVMAIFSDSFLTRGNILNMLRQLSINGIVAVGMTFVLITGGIDLSVALCLRSRRWSDARSYRPAVRIRLRWRLAYLLLSVLA